MKNKFFNLNNKKLLLVIFLFLILITLLTKFYGLTDINDYASSAKYFAGKYSAKIRSSHSYLFGFLHSPYIWLTNSFIGFKITSLIFLALIIYSVYLINKKDKKTLWLMGLSPIIWYMAPWINPIQLSALLVLWAYFFINKFDKENKIKYLALSGILIGLACSFWDTILFIAILLSISFLYNKKSYFFLFFILFFIAGLMPRLLLDQVLFNFPFYGLFKNFFAVLANISGGIYERASGWDPKNFINLFSVFLVIPFYIWILYKPSFLKRNKKTMIFLSLCLLGILSNPQIRYTLIIAPIIILLLGRTLNDKQFKIQLIIFLIIGLLIINPYLIQIKYSTNAQELNSAIANLGNWHINSTSQEQIILNNLNQIIQDYPDEVFVVGNRPDSYAYLAYFYWEEDVKEFVSIQDYNLVLENKTVLYEKKFMPIPNIADRRQIWFAGGMNKNENDDTDYENIEFGIGIEEPIKIKGFEVIEKYGPLYLSKRIMPPKQEKLIFCNGTPTIFLK